MRGQPGLFDIDDRLKRLSDLGDQLLAFAKVVDFELLRSELGQALAYSDGLEGGRPPFDPVMMFKILVIQAAMGAQIVDATLVSAPKQRNTEDEKRAIKEGRIPEDWPTKPAKLAHKDRDARWTVKFSKARERADGLEAAGRHRHPNVRLSEPRRHRPRIRADPPLRGD